jgi:hypothetical protein
MCCYICLSLQWSILNKHYVIEWVGGGSELMLFTGLTHVILRIPALKPA